MRTERAGNRKLICLCLILLTIGVFWRAGHNEFISLDDPWYITQNPHVFNGITFENVRWAFTATEMSNWHPLTWLSHMADCQLYGLDPAGHHLTSVAFHLGNTVLLFFVLELMTGALWRSAFVAALFAVHPLHVESVAWAAERKDVLSTFFWMLTVLSYIWYVKRTSWRRYSLVLVLFILGLMTKPMLVTLPIILLILDYWPLRRMRLGLDAAVRPQGVSAVDSGLSLWRCSIEKIPFFAVALASCVVTLYAQQHGGSVTPLGAIPLEVRCLNALVSLGAYMKKMFLPFNLSVIYPLDPNIPVWQPVLSGVIIVAISFVAFRSARRRPYLIAGWLWYLVTLVPVIGIVQVGLQSMADRYTYIPLIGLFIMVAWGIEDILKGRHYRQAASLLSGIFVIGALALSSSQQLRHWKNSIELFSYANSVTRNNYLAQESLGSALVYEGKIEEAVGHFSEAIKIDPDVANGYYNMGVALEKLKKPEEAARFYAETIALMPNSERAHKNLGALLARAGRRDEAAAHFAEALRINPGYLNAHFNIGVLLFDRGNFYEALPHLSYVVRSDPGNEIARNYLLRCLNATGN